MTDDKEPETELTEKDLAILDAVSEGEPLIEHEQVISWTMPDDDFERLRDHPEDYEGAMDAAARAAVAYLRRERVNILNETLRFKFVVRSESGMHLPLEGIVRIT